MFLGGILPKCYETHFYEYKIYISIKKYLTELLWVGGRIWLTLNNYPNYEVEFDVEQGIVTDVRLIKNGEVVEHKHLALIYNNKTGELVDSFIKLRNDELKNLEDHTIKRLYLNKRGDLILAGNYLAAFKNFPEAEVEILVKEGKPVLVRFIKDRENNPILDKIGQFLEISLEDNIKKQLFALLSSELKSYKFLLIENKLY